MKYTTAFLVLVLAIVADARANVITLTFSGTIDHVLPSSFAPIPAGSLFSGTFTYDSEAPQTGGGAGLAIYYDLAPSNASVTVNGFTFATTTPRYGNPGLQVISAGGRSPYSGVSLGTQPISLPAGWSAVEPSFPYFTLWFFDNVQQHRSLTLPTVTSDFPVGRDVFTLASQSQTVSVDGQTFGDGVGMTGTINSFSVAVASPTAVPEPGNMTLVLVGLAGLIPAMRRKAVSGKWGV